MGNHIVRIKRVPRLPEIGEVGSLVRRRIKTIPDKRNVRDDGGRRSALAYRDAQTKRNCRDKRIGDAARNNASLTVIKFHVPKVYHE